MKKVNEATQHFTQLLTFFFSPNYILAVHCARSVPAQAIGGNETEYAFAIETRQINKIVRIGAMNSNVPVPVAPIIGLRRRRKKL